LPNSLWPTLTRSAPSAVDEKQLRELHIRLRNPQPAG
jgi:aspartyl-tRNA synthetase